MHRIPLATLLWVGLLMVCALGLTIATYFSLVLPEQRGLTFYSALVSSCAAEFILFCYLAYFLTVPHTVKRPSPAVRMRVLVLLVIWCVVVMASSGFAASPANADTFFSDKIVLFQGILTFFLLVGVYFFHRQDVVLQLREEAPQRERVRLQSYAGGVDALLDRLRWVAERRPQSAVELDRLAKRLDTLKTQLLTVSPAAQREPGRLVQPVSTEGIEEQLRALQEAVSQLDAASDDRFDAQLVNVRQSIEALSALLRRREDVMTF